MKNYSAYTIIITEDQACYGVKCNDAEATIIAKTLGTEMKKKFPGITTKITPNSQACYGPDDLVCEEIVRNMQETYSATDWASLFAAA